MIQGARIGNARRIVPYHTKCDANYSEADSCLPCRIRLAVVTEEVNLFSHQPLSFEKYSRLYYNSGILF